MTREKWVSKCLMGFAGTCQPLLRITTDANAAIEAMVYIDEEETLGKY
jgi:hypothetical protein